MTVFLDTQNLGSCCIFSGAGHSITDRKQPVNCSQPETYVQFWQQLLNGTLQWRWHYMFYILLVGNSLWQAAKMLLTYRQFLGQANSVDLDDDL